MNLVQELIRDMSLWKPQREALEFCLAYRKERAEEIPEEIDVQKVTVAI